MKFSNACLLFVILNFFAHAQEFSTNEYIVNLDFPPHLRYFDVLNDHREIIYEFRDSVLNKFPDILKFVFEFAFFVMNNTDFYKEYAQEIIGISDVLKMSIKDVFTMNCIYEIYALCTSIVSRDINGKILLARNLDFPYTGLLQRNHVLLNYIKNGKTLFYCSGMAGFVGVLTCQKPYEFAISLNMRALDNPGLMFFSLFQGIPPVTWLFRKVMTVANNYDDAVNIFKTEYAVSGSYAIIAGKSQNEGCIITNDRRGVKNIISLQDDKWFLVQCNTDNWINGDYRTEIGKKYMTELGQQNVTLTNLYQEALGKYPLLQGGTIVTVLMNPTDSILQTIVNK